jgi:hypothetical protein
VWSGIRSCRYLRHERECKALSIASLTIAVAYLFLIVVGAVVALLLLVWLFRDTPGVDRRTGRETFRGLRDTDRFRSESASSAQVGYERPKDEAA